MLINQSVAKKETINIILRSMSRCPNDSPTQWHKGAVPQWILEDSALCNLDF